MNIILLIIDTLRDDHIGAHGNDWTETPNMDRLAATSAGPAWESHDFLFTVFDRDWYLVVAPTPEASRLTRMGALDDCQADYPDVALGLYSRRLDELERRGCDPRLMRWVRRAGTEPFPSTCRFHDGWPGPPGYTQYFNRLYHGE